MRSKAMKTFAYLAVVLMLVSVLPLGALAAPNGDQSMKQRGVNVSNDDMDRNMTRDQIRDGINVTEDVPRAEAFVQNRIKTGAQLKTNVAVANGVAQYRSAKERIETVRNDYADAKKDFQDLRIKINNKKASADSEEAVEATRAYMNHTIEYMIAHLETVKENVENAGGDSADDISETIDGYIEQLQQQQANVESAQIRQDFADAAKDVRKIWNDAQKRAKYFAGKSLDRRLDNYLAKSDALSLRIGAEIDRLNETGVNVEELEGLLGEYNGFIEEAKRNQELAREAVRNGNGDDDDPTNDANVYMREATRNIQEANKVLKDIFDELKSHRSGGSVSLDGAGKLTTEGNGTAVFSGNLDINISATNAKLVIKDLAGDANIVIEGEYTLVNDDEDGDNNRALVYHNFTGTAHINGSRLTVMVHGEDLSITAEGDGSSILSGRGSYNVEKAGKSSEKMKWAGDDDIESMSVDAAADDENEIEDNDTEENETEDNDTEENETDVNDTEYNETMGDD